MKKRLYKCLIRNVYVVVKMGSKVVFVYMLMDALHVSKWLVLGGLESSKG